MYAQLGNILFANQNGFDSFSKTDDTTYAQHDLISGKPRLQPVANELEEITISLHLRAEFVNVEDSILALKTSKDTFEVLPLVLGSGRYMGDYVITSIGETHNTAFDDGLLIDATVSLTIREYSTTDKLQQQQNAARKNAFAVGDKKPILTGITQPATVAQTATQDASIMNSECKEIDQAVRDYANNPSKAEQLATKIQKSIANTQESIEKYQGKINVLASVFEDTNSVEQALQNLSDATNSFTFPVPGLGSLQSSNLFLQAALQGFNTANSILNYKVIIRRA